MTELKELIYRLIEDRLHVQCFPCEVLQVNKEKDSCVVKPYDEGPELFNVRLTATIEEKDSKLLCYPKVGSTVLAGIIDGEETDAFVVAFSEIEELIIQSEKVTINEGTLGGLIKIEELKTQLGKTSEVITAMQQSFNAWTPAPNDGGAALKSMITSALAGKTVGSYENIENDKITHG